MSDNRKYYYLKLKENYFDDDSIVLLESMQDGVLYSNILLKLYLKSLKHGGRLQLDEDIPYTAQMIATITRQQIGTVERALQIFLKLGLVEVLDSGTFYMSNIELLIGQSSTEAERKRAARLQNKALSALRTSGGHLSDIRPPEIGIILTFIACYELIEMITQHNNMAQFEPALIMRWIFKTAVSVWLISNTFDIVMAVFDITQKVVSDSSGIIAGNTRVNDIGLSMLEASLMQMDVGPLFGLFLQSFFIGITMRILSIIIFVIVYGRMIEIYCMVSLAPIPMATWGNHEQSHMGQNYLKCLFALGFQGFLILICVAIYAVLIQSVAISGDAINSIWSIVGYTVLLCFSLFKTSSVTKSVLGAH